MSDATVNLALFLIHVPDSGNATPAARHQSHHSSLTLRKVVFESNKVILSSCEMNGRRDKEIFEIRKTRHISVSSVSMAFKLNVLEILNEFEFTVRKMLII